MDNQDNIFRNGFADEAHGGNLGAAIHGRSFTAGGHLLDCYRIKYSAVNTPWYSDFILLACSTVRPSKRSSFLLELVKSYPSTESPGL